MSDLELLVDEDDGNIVTLKFSRSVFGTSVSITDYNEGENYYSDVVTHLTPENTTRLKEWL